MGRKVSMLSKFIRKLKGKAAPSKKERIVYVQDGRAKRTNYTFFRGSHANFHPTDETLQHPDLVAQYVMKGFIPDSPPIDRQTPIVAFGSCFASNISRYLFNQGYNILTKKDHKAYVSSMGDGIVNTFAIRQQFEWAWKGKTPGIDLWHGYKAEHFGYDEDVRKTTKDLFDAADVFIITLGLSEVWYDEPTGEVFWRAVPMDHYDETRHKFRVSTVSENLDNLVAIRQLIRQNRPGAAVIFTLSPVPLTATFKDASCVVANSASKAILRAALEEFMQGDHAQGSFYFPSYEIVTKFFERPFMEDRKNPHEHVLTFNMKVFHAYYCHRQDAPIDLAKEFHHARELDSVVVSDGHFAVPRTRSAR